MTCWSIALLAVVASEAATTTGHGYLSITNEATTDVSIAVTGIASQVDTAGNVVSATNSYTSDRRWKQNITNLTYGAATVAQLRSVEFEWADSHPSAGSGKQIGFVAQEVELVVPEIVRTDTKGYKSIMYDRFAVISVKAIQELQSTIENQEADIGRLRAIAATFEARLTTVEAQLAAQNT
ncbi:hypothetical protein CTAYLR_003890 [Chrysophaeum taylorii]|uniref:Peptidase S74 domain-containing protein n=1 Tax=Chrysophaeum taylorii TaxID=2483200 RepID=A0AAD7UL48_9STRA|nr:hypothetical protein CTAYLR_003890 [Chrysophaeum taylorii]